MNLVPAIREIEAQMRQIKSRHEKELQPYKESLDALKKINNACLDCGGIGKIFKRSCAEDEGDYYTCKSCHGTGDKIS